MKTPKLWVTILANSLLLSGCVGTVTPAHVSPAQASFDASGDPAQVQHIRDAQATNSGPIIVPSAAPIILPSWTSVVAGSTNGPTSGLLGFVGGQAVITPHAVDRYNALMVEFGAAWPPGVHPGDGVTPFGDNYRIDSAHLFYFVTANRWHKEGKAVAK